MDLDLDFDSGLGFGFGFWAGSLCLCCIGSTGEVLCGMYCTVHVGFVIHFEKA